MKEFWTDFIEIIKCKTFIKILNIKVWWLRRKK